MNALNQKTVTDIPAPWQEAPASHPPRHRRALIAGTGVVLIAAVGLWLMQRGGPVVIHDTAPVVVRDLETSVTASGKIEPHAYVDVGAQVSGQLRSLHVAAGDQVTVGQLLAEIDAEVQAAQVEGLEAELARTGGWGCWALSNHDVPRVATRWAPHGQANDHLSITLLALLLSLKGSVCLYQGEELGLPEADIPFERLQDPYGKAFWPRFKGRDGCRTPMPWWKDAPQAGFNTGAEPWLPLGEEHAARAVDRQEIDPASVLSQARALLAWRRGEPRLRRGEIRFHHAEGPHALLFERRLPGQPALVLAFNLGTRAVNLLLPDTLGGLAAAQGAPLSSAVLSTDGREWHLPPYSAALATR